MIARRAALFGCCRDQIAALLFGCCRDQIAYSSEPNVRLVDRAKGEGRVTDNVLHLGSFVVRGATGVHQPYLDGLE
jgi:hypothetical protein